MVWKPAFTEESCLTYNGEVSGHGLHQDFKLSGVSWGGNEVNQLKWRADHALLDR